MSAVHEYVGGTHCSCIVSSACDVLGIRVVRGMRGAVWVVRGLVDKRIGVGLYQSCRNCVSVFGLRWCRWGLVPGSVRSGVMSV